MTNEMIERVADAMLVPFSEGKSMQEVARVAIAAMRTPTEAMSYAAMHEKERSNSEFPGGESGPAIDPNGEEYWRAMIDAALKEEPKP